MIILELSWLRKYIVRIVSSEGKNLAASETESPVEKTDTSFQSPSDLETFFDNTTIENIEESMIDNIAAEQSSENGQVRIEELDSDNESGTSGVELEGSDNE